jgi:hypothetical protein
MSQDLTAKKKQSISFYLPILFTSIDNMNVTIYPLPDTTALTLCVGPEVSKICTGRRAYSNIRDVPTGRWSLSFCITLFS